ncbi:MAG: enoyl-CoA hydratase [Rhodospirillales bacterium]|nr:enoyl-CoA hydratase [Rhodospirillales bacterium]
MSAAILSPNETVLADVREGVCWITFNRPTSLNAINPDLVDALDQILSAVDGHPDIRCVVLQGAGDHFMAGGDIKKFKRMLDTEPDVTARSREFERLLHNVHRVIVKMRQLPQPIVAWVHGAVAGAGVSLMLACDLVIAADNAFFTLAYCHLGVSPDGGSTYHLPRSVGLKRSFQIALLGDRFDAETAEKWGLINWVFAADQVQAEARKIISRLANGPTAAHGHAKALLNASLSTPMDIQLDKEIDGFVDCTASKDFEEGVRAFIEKRKPEFTGRS